MRQKKITKKHSSGLILKTEGTLAKRVGHLEMVGGGKKGGVGVGNGKDGDKKKVK